MKREKRSFFERITQSIRSSSKDEDLSVPDEETANTEDENTEEDSGAQLAVDLYQTPAEIIVIAMIAGVKPDDLDVTITREMVVIKARRNPPESVDRDNYIYKELYWGAFDRTIVLPDEVDADDSEAVEKHGLLVIKMPKINKNRTKALKVKTLS